MPSDKPSSELLPFAKEGHWFFYLLVLLFSVHAVHAACSDDDPLFTQAVSEGHYDKALKKAVLDLHLSKGESATLHIVPGLQETNGNRNAEADPDNDVVNLDPRLFLEGLSGVCQAVAHELQHLRQFRWDRQVLHAYYQSAPAPYRTAWDGCDVSALSVTPAQLEQSAFDCLEDDKLATHAAVFEIDGVLHQVPYAVPELRDEDRDYLLDHLQQFAFHAAQLRNPSNEAYYLPQIKRKDRATFCQGIHYARKQGWDVALLLQSDADLCGGFAHTPRR